MKVSTAPLQSGTEASYIELHLDPTRQSSTDRNSQPSQLQGNSYSTTTRSPSTNRRNMGERGPLIAIAVVVGVIAVVAVILIPISFAGLEYYEYGFKRRKTTGAVDTEKVFGPGGRHPVGPDNEFKTFMADAHFEHFKAVTIFTADRLQVQITCSVQYFLRKHHLTLLHSNYDIYYRPVLRSNALDALKGAATSFSTREYIRNREVVEAALFSAVRDRLGGKCCERDCVKPSPNTPKSPMLCVAGCIPFNRCGPTDWGLFGEVRYFQLRSVAIPNEINRRFLQALVLQESTETEKLKQQSKVIRKEYDAESKQILNEAAETRQNATAKASLITSKAEANSRAIVENARSQGLKILYSELGITDPKQRASFDYLRTLRGSSKVKLTVNYDQLIAGPLSPN